MSAPGGRGPSGGSGVCLVPPCRAEIPAHRLMCGAHWYAVPKALRDRVWAAWRSGRGIHAETYWAAIREAVAAAQAPPPQETPW